MSEFSILEARKTLQYRLLEIFLGFCSFSFLVFLVITSAIYPEFAAIFLIVYSFFWLLRVAIICLYTIYSYKNLRRWESFNLPRLLDSFDKNLDEVRDRLFLIKKKFEKSLDWASHIQKDIDYLPKLQNSKFGKPNRLFHIPIFSVYNESSEILTRSLRSIFDSGYDLSRIVVFISQEARLGQQANKNFRNKITNLKWINASNISETNLSVVYNSDHTELNNYRNEHFAKFKIQKNKLNVIFVQHPDGLEGEIKGKASNEDWAGRQASLFVHSQKIDPELVLLTSLDADSRLGKNYFHLLSLRFCLTDDRLQSGFQPIPVYSNNFFNTGLIPRLIATQTTLYQFAQNAVEDDVVFFANYSLPLVVVRNVNFWVRDGIAEDYLLFAKCYIKYQSNFRVIPFYGVFEGDAVEAEDYIESIANQYKQLQRWSWGGVESFPYMFYNLFISPKKPQISIFKKIKKMFSLFANHFFWATTPLFFSIGVFLPVFFGGEVFKSTPAGQSLSNFSSIFALMSIVFLCVFTFITFNYIAPKANQGQKLSLKYILMIITQWIVSPFIYGFIGIPALDSQIRGVFGKYLGYWVTPKK